MNRKRATSADPATMMSASSGRDRRMASNGHADSAEDLPYAVELWDLGRGRVERVLGRASSAMLAQAIFAAAQTEHLGRKITLRHGDKVIAART